MKHANIATTTSGSQDLGHYGANAARYGGFRDDWPWSYQLLRIIGLWLDRGRQRRALKLLDDRMLKDTGLTRFDAARESAKPAWQP